MSKRIVIDARILGSSTGVYAENLVNHLQSVDTENEYIILEREKGSWTPTAPNFRTIHAPIKDYTFSEQFRLAALLYELKPDLVHFCMPQQPLLYFGKRVTTVHDTTLVRFENIDMNPLLYKVRKWIFTLLLKNVVWRSKAVLTPTEYVRRDLLDFTSKRYASKIIKTHEAGEPLAAAAEAMLQFKNKRFILSINNAFPYKNLSRIADAFLVLKQTYPDLQLLYAGKPSYFYEQLATYVAKKNIPDVHFLGFISEGEKRWALQHAEAYIVASLSEGFHITGLEAMYEGCPVVSSNATCLPEVNGDAALYFDPHSTSELVRAVSRVIEDKDLRDKLTTRGHKRVKDFSWHRMAEETKAVYGQALGA